MVWLAGRARAALTTRLRSPASIAIVVCGQAAAIIGRTDRVRRGSAGDGPAAVGNASGPTGGGRQATPRFHDHARLDLPRAAVSARSASTFLQPPMHPTN